MFTIKNLPIADLSNSNKMAMRGKAEAVGVPNPVFFQIMYQVPGYCEPLFEALFESHVNGNIDHGLKEIIRILLARQAKDQYFSNLRSKIALENGLTEERIEAGCGEFELDGSFSEEEKWALKYAKLMYTDPKRINSEFYDQGKSFYSEAEIMELGSFIAFHYGMQPFFATLNLSPKFE